MSRCPFRQPLILMVCRVVEAELSTTVVESVMEVVTQLREVRNSRNEAYAGKIKNLSLPYFCRVPLADYCELDVWTGRVIRRLGIGARRNVQHHLACLQTGRRGTSPRILKKEVELSRQEGGRLAGSCLNKFGAHSPMQPNHSLLQRSWS